jgi:hypothetical protein
MSGANDLPSARGFLMRILVFILALLGTGLSAAVGYIWMDQMQKSSGELGNIHARIEKDREAAKRGGLSQENLASKEEAYQTLVRLNRVWPFLLAGAALGLFGGVLALARRGKLAAALMLAAAVAPVILLPIPQTLVAVAGLALGGLLALLVKSRQSEPAVA